MASIGQLFAELGIDSTKFRSGLNRARKDMNSFEAKMNLARRNMSKGFRRLEKDIFSMRTAVLGLATGAMAQFIKSTIAFADGIAKTADKIGFTTVQLQELRFAADLAGVAQNALDMGLQRFSRRVAEVAAGTGELKKVAEQYDVQLRDSSGRLRQNIDILNDFADVIRNAESDQEALRIAFKLFDSEGAALVNMMREGSAAMSEMRQQAQELGIVLDERLISNAEVANDKLAMMGQVLKTRVTVAVLELTPEMVNLADAVLGLDQRVRKHEDTWINFSKVIVTSAGNTFRVAKGILQSMAGVVAGVLGIAAGANEAFIKSMLPAQQTAVDVVNKIRQAFGQSPIQSFVDNSALANAAQFMENLRKTGLGSAQDLFGGALSEFEGIKGLDFSRVSLGSQSDRVFGDVVAAAGEAGEKARKAFVNSLKPMAFKVDQDMLKAALPGFAGLENFLKNGNVLERFQNQISGINLEAGNTLAAYRAEQDKLTESLLAYEEMLNLGLEKENQLARARETLTFLIQNERISVDEATAAYDRLQQSLNGAVDQSEAFKQAVGNAISQFGDQFFDTFVNGLKTGEFAFKAFAASVLEDLSKLIFKLMVTIPIANALQAALSGGFGGLFGGGVSANAFQFPTQIPALAGGGTAIGGRPHLVGERGPELFVPGRTGTVVPNHALGGGTPVIVNQNITINAGVAEQVRLEIMRARPQLRKDAVDAVQQGIARGQGIARSVGVRR